MPQSSTYSCYFHDSFFYISHISSCLSLLLIHIIFCLNLLYTQHLFMQYIHIFSCLILPYIILHASIFYIFTFFHASIFYISHFSSCLFSPNNFYATKAINFDQRQKHQQNNNFMPLQRLFHSNAY